MCSSHIDGYSTVPKKEVKEENKNLLKMSLYTCIYMYIIYNNRQMMMMYIYILYKLYYNYIIITIHIIYIYIYHYIYGYHYIYLSLSIFQFQSLKGLSWLNTTEQHQHIPRPRSAGALHASKKKALWGQDGRTRRTRRYFAHWKRRCLSSMVIVQTHVSGPCPSAPACWDSAGLSQNSPLIFNVQ